MHRWAQSVTTANNWTTLWNCTSFVMFMISFRNKVCTGFGKQKKELAKVLREGVVNEIGNLNITSAVINAEKCNAVQEFQAVYLDKIYRT